VAKGFSQREGVNYEETFAPVARYSSIGTVISLAAKMDWHVHQMDVKTALLNEVIDEEVYIEQPAGFDVGDRDTHVCKLRQALYGLKQAPRVWYSRIDNYLREMGFQQSEADPNLYFLTDEVPLILVLYVDDLFLTEDEQLIADCKANLAAEFEMKDLGLIHYFLGLEVWQTYGCFFLGQGKYTMDILRRFGMTECRPMSMPLVTNWRKIDVSSSEMVDPTIYSAPFSKQV
jgi:hypothetical protein